MQVFVIDARDPCHDLTDQGVVSRVIIIKVIPVPPDDVGKVLVAVAKIYPVVKGLLYSRYFAV